MEPICYKLFDAQELARDFPARVGDRSKKIVFEMSTPQGATHSATFRSHAGANFRYPRE